MTETDKYNQFPRGSVWKKWDLHVHTPVTKLCNNYEKVGEGPNWDLFCEKLEESDVMAIGITDYFAISSYFEFVNKFQEKYPDSNKVFFPNIEFRIDSKNKNGDHIQIHVVFSNEKTTLDKIGNCLTRLKLVSTDDENLTNKYCTDEHIAELTYEKAMVKIDDLTKSLKSDFTSDEYIILGVATGYGSLRPESGDGRGSEYAKEIDKVCNAFFGKSENADFFLNKIDGRSQYKLKPKAVLGGSDSHSFVDLDNKLGKIFTHKNESDEIDDFSEITWIKADLTFQGLKQITYEPEDRIKIQELKPDEKEDYQIIDKIKFIDDDFLPEDILINQNLTAIIGGKSTGKSILLRNIAKTIDADEVSRRLNEVNLEEYPEQVDDFRVFWRDKQENKKNEEDGVTKKIIYIPQSYLNRLVDKQEDKTSIDEIIKNVLEQDNDVQKTFESLGNFERENEKAISKSIDDLFYTKNDIEALTDGSKKIGDKKGITAEIIKLKAEIADLKKKSGMTDDEIKKYNELIEKITELRGKQEKIDNDLLRLEGLKTVNIFSDPSLFGLSDQIYKILHKDYEEIKLKTSKEWLSKIESQEKEVKVEKVKIKTELDKLNTEFNPLLEKAKKSKSLEEKIKKLDSEEKNLKAIILEETKIKDLKVKYENLIVEIANKQAQFFEEMFNAKTKILKQAVIDGVITFDLSITFRNSYFQEYFVNEICNLKNINQFEGGLLNEYKYSDSTKLKEDTENTIRGILNGSLVLKNSYSKKEAITKLVVNWFIFDYKIKQNGDELSHMSPGKKSFVLLKLLIELDNSKCPILLDQPEDDLDNRSIYDDLVKFIKDKKKERQIIIATHNPNLVVGADAECVIVANQNGDKSKNKIYKFEYVEGALENSFEISSEDKILYKQGIQEHVCDILEGGRIAFKQRKNKYNIN